jgi:uncharacterized protein YneF (UPF0154 family)
MKRILAVGLMVIGVGLVVGAIGWTFFDHPSSQFAEGSLPDSIAGIRLASSTAGAKAIQEVSSMHGKEFPIEFGEIGIYGNREITVWVAGAATRASALQMTSAMQEKIAQGNSPFTPTNEIQNKERKVYVLDGMGQRHYYFQSNNLVIWLAANPPVADAAIQQILEVYP